MSKSWTPDRLDRENYHGPGLDLPVFYGDLDIHSHLNNVNFGRFFEQSRFVEHLGVGVMELMEREPGRRVLVARVSVDYLGEVRFGSDLHLRLRTSRFARSSFQEQQAMWQDDRCVALADVVLVCADDKGSAPLSAAMRTTFQRLEHATLATA